MDYFTHLLSIIKDFSIFGYLIIFILAFFESFAFVGLIIPGSIAVIIGGFLVAQGIMDLGDLFIFASLGAILGDSFSFYLGKKGIISFHENNRIFKLSLLEKGESYFRKHGGKSVFWGRFIGWVRPIIPFVAGVFNLNKKTFYFWNILSGLLWAVTHIAVGFFFGQTWETISVWTTRGSAFLLGFFLFVFILYILKWLVVKKGKQFLYFSLSVLHSIKYAIINNSDVKSFVNKHHLFFKFIKGRLDKSRFWGLPVTLLSFAFIYTITLFVGIIEDIITPDLITSIDTRVNNLLALFRNTDLTQFFLWITLLGKWQIVLIFSIATISILCIWRKRLYILPLLLTIIGSEIFTALGKIAFHRPRPELAIYTEHSFSFPSGHATIAMAFYGFITYILIRHSVKWKTKVNIFFIGLAVILLIGFSRLYLGVHYVSDVWGGYLVGALWLIIGISISEWIHSWRKNGGKFLPKRKTYIVSITLIILSILSYIVFATNYHPQITSTPTTQKEAVIQNVNNIFIDEQLRYSEGLIGERQEPISFIIFADNDKKFMQVLRNSGWHFADEISVGSFFKIAKASVLKKEYLNAPMTPSFWNKQTHNFGFQKPTSSNNVRQRHHARFWKTNYITENGKRVYVGTASLDEGIKWGVTHEIAPDIDTEREFLFNDLQESKELETFQKEQFVKPILGENFSGDQFFTDGKAYILTF